MLSRFGHKTIVVLAMDIRSTCYYEMLAETVNGVDYLGFLKRPMNHRHGNRKHAVWLLDDNARPHRNASVTSWINQRNILR